MTTPPKMVSKTPDIRTAGFTLIEVLTAMMILAIALVTVMQLFSGGLRAVRRSGDVTRSLFQARATMEEALLAGVMTDGEWEGRYEDGTRWRLIIRELRETEPDLETDTKPGAKAVDSRPAPRGAAGDKSLFRVSVSVFRENGVDNGTRERGVELTTLHMARRWVPPPDNGKP